MKEIIYRKPKKIEKTSRAEKLRSELVSNVIADYEERKLKRREFELQWRLNLDFYAGKQNSIITSFDTLVNVGKQFHWQRTDSFNHIAPIVESRLSKITSHKVDIEPTPDTDEQHDMDGIPLCKKILESAFAKTDFDAMVEQATMWSEVTGSVFYKVYWDNNAGSVLGMIKQGDTENEIRDGDVCISICSPFEIFPDKICASCMGEISSLIHAKYLSHQVIKESWGVDLSGYAEDNILVIERYQVPTKAYPNGRFVIIAMDKLIYDGELPYINGEDGKRTIPFVRQVSEGMVGSFYGRSVIERAIPVQRAYNAIKNRKVEFLNRLACGVLTVEEGSVDIESLENDGLAPGKVIVYRHGTTAPKFLNTGSLPAELEREEERLLKEFELVSGGGDIMRGLENGNVSGVALAILTEENDRRMNRTIQAMVRAKMVIACHILRLYKQFVTSRRLERIVGESGVEMFDFDQAAITCRNVIVRNAGMMKGEMNEGN
ncbi:MAG: hypothetical protein FWE45_02605 [Firmicutes bacterium]|nr:hypothetical protein [Bacillota bacterium]